MVTGALWFFIGFVIIFLYRFLKPKKSKLKNKKDLFNHQNKKIVKKTISKISKASSETVDHIVGLPSQEDVEEAAIEIVKESLKEITPEEEEEIYAKAFREYNSPGRREGIWSKALIQSEGDEAKAKIIYIKLRVNQLTVELIKSKSNKDSIKNFFESKFNINSSIIDKLEYLATESKKNKINNQELISTEYIKFLINEESRLFGHGNINNIKNKLKLLIVNSSNGNEHNFINTIEIDKIVRDYKSDNKSYL